MYFKWGNYLMIPQTLQQYLISNEWENALNFLESTKEQLGDDLLERKAWCCSRLEKYPEAIEIYRDLLSRQPNNAKWLYSLGYQFYAQKNYSKSVEYFERALEIYPEYLKVKYRIAYAYLQLSGTENQWTKDVYCKAIKHLKDSHIIYSNYSLDQKEKDKSTYADICALHGKTMLNSQKYIDNAIELFYLSLSLKYDEDVQYQLAKGYYLKKDYQGALDNLPKSNKPSYYVLELEAQILTDNQKYEESNKVLFRIIKFRRKDYLYQRIANNFLSIGNNGKAMEFALKAVSLDGRNYKNYLICGRICKEIKQYKTSIEYLEKARLNKQKKYQCDEPEAIRLIEEINVITSNYPIDEICVANSLEQQVGIISKYNSSRGFGFIRAKLTGKDYFFHIKSVLTNRLPTQGMEVRFEIMQSEKGQVATNIIFFFFIIF